MKNYTLLLLFLISLGHLYAQNAVFKGTITADGEPLTGVNVSLLNSTLGDVTDAAGRFTIERIPAGEWTVHISYVGYRTVEKPVVISEGATKVLDLSLRQDVLNLDAVVVSATRNTIPMHEAPVIVNRIDDRVFERTQSLSMSEGLSFSPGLRLENNCQNCGFTQVRMNGLDGPYTQILINSRPVFSALTGVYGLDMIPTNMIDRVEVVRGGGSALYGGNAIAGTINVITKEPMTNTYEFSTNIAAVNLEQPDRTLSANGAIVSEDLKKGISFYGFNRERSPWDANGDGFSEMTKLRNTTFGFDAFYKPTDRSKLKLNVFNINEFRRGGNKFELPPHQTDITEQLDHNILGGSLSYEQFSKDLRHKWAVYTSATHTGRDSYYGGGGRVLQPGDQLTPDDLLALNAYGQSEDVALAAGAQYSYDLSNQFLLTAGAEYQYNDVIDEMPGYDRSIDQQVGTLGSYAQLQWKPAERWSFLLGGRYDRVRIEGMYALEVEELSNDQTFDIFVPRLTAKYNFTPDLKLRLSYAQGYRTPQAFDEDLHIETVGGAARFTRLDPELEPERSHSLNGSLDYTIRNDGFESNIVLDGFYTRLNNPFITANPVELPSGVAVVTKRNGGGAAVGGVNAEVNLAFSGDFILQLGGTVQTARYDEAEEIWAPETDTDAGPDSIVTSRNMLRTPNVYGFTTANWSPGKRLDLSLSGVFTGPMKVPHIIDPATEFTAIENTPSFFELNTKVSYEIPVNKLFHLDVFAGVQNLFNSYQNDFDSGADRDAGYIYGPARPRTVFAGMKVHFE